MKRWGDLVPLSELAVGLFLAVLLGLLLSCGQPEPVRPEPVPADAEAERLAAAYVEESTRAIDDSQAAEQATREAQAPGLTPEQVAAKHAEADRRRAEADRHRALAAEIKRLRDEARARAVVERTELDMRAISQEVAAGKAADARRLSWCVALAIALATGSGALLLWLGVPRRLALGIPGAVIVAALALSAWVAAGAWIALTLGVAMALAVIAFLAGLLIAAVREWHHAMAVVGKPGDPRRDQADTDSMDRQSTWTAWIFDHLLPRHAPPQD